MYRDTMKSTQSLHPLLDSWTAPTTARGLSNHRLSKVPYGVVIGMHTDSHVSPCELPAANKLVGEDPISDELV
jgi:hypothetical protein